MTTLTQREQQILEYIEKFIKEKGFPPTVREIGKAVGLKSTSTVHSYINRLISKNKLKKINSKSRALDLVDKKTENNEQIVKVPIVGRVAAGTPILAEQNIEDYFPLPEHFVSGTTNKVFMLRVQGDSMIEAGIHDKDYVIVKQQNTCENGEIVVALIDNEATVKTFYKEKDCIRLQPQNPYLEPIIAKNVKIIGKVIGVVRKF